MTTHCGRVATSASWALLLFGLVGLLGCDGGTSKNGEPDGGGPDGSTSGFDYSPQNISVLRVRSDVEGGDAQRVIEQRAEVSLDECFVARNLSVRNTSFTMHEDDCAAVLALIEQGDLLGRADCAEESPPTGSYLVIDYDDGVDTASCAIGSEPAASSLDEYLLLPVHTMPWPIDLKDEESPYDQSIVSSQAGNYFHHGVDVGCELLEQVYSPCRGRVTNLGVYMETAEDPENRYEVELTCVSGIRLQYHHVDETTVTAAAEESFSEDSIIEAGVELASLVDFELNLGGGIPAYSYPHLHLNAVDERGAYLNPLVLMETLDDTEPPVIDDIDLVPADDQYTQLADGGVDAYGDFWVDVTTVDQRTLEELFTGMGVVPPRSVSFVVKAQGSDQVVLEHDGYDFLSLPVDECAEAYTGCVDVGYFEYFPHGDRADVIRSNGLNEQGVVGVPVDAQTLGGGMFDITVTACDEYGNCSEETVAFEVVSSAG